MAVKKDYEDLTGSALTAQEQEELIRSHNECTFIWSRKDGWPVGVIMSYVWRDGQMWLTSARQRPRVTAVQRDPRVCVVISNGGKDGVSRTLTIKGRCTLHEDAETKRWFYPALAKALHSESETIQKRFEKMLDSPDRTVLAVKPEQRITFDSVKMNSATGLFEEA